MTFHWAEITAQDGDRNCGDRSDDWSIEKHKEKRHERCASKRRIIIWWGQRQRGNAKQERKDNTTRSSNDQLHGCAKGRCKQDVDRSRPAEEQ